MIDSNKSYFLSVDEEQYYYDYSNSDQDLLAINRKSQPPTQNSRALNFDLNPVGNHNHGQKSNLASKTNTTDAFSYKMLHINMYY